MGQPKRTWWVTADTGITVDGQSDVTVAAGGPLSTGGVLDVDAGGTLTIGDVVDGDTVVLNGDQAVVVDDERAADET